MSRVVALGRSARVEGFALAGVTVLETDEGGAEAAWSRLPNDTGLLLLTSDAADELRDRLEERARLIWTEIPE